MEPVKPALLRLPRFFSTEKRLKYASLLEEHKEHIAQTGALPKEILDEAEKDFAAKRHRATKIGFITGTVLGTGFFQGPENMVFWPLAGSSVGKAVSFLARKAKNTIAALAGIREKQAMKPEYSPYTHYRRNIDVLEERIRQLRGKYAKPIEQARWKGQQPSAP